MYHRVIAYHFLVLFLLCSFQVGVKSHYCCGKYIGTRLVMGDGEISCGMKPEADVSCETGEKIKKKCCENFLAKLQFQNDFGVAKVISVPALTDVVASFYAYEVHTFPGIVSVTENAYSLNPPPDLSVMKEDLSRLQVFKI